jgi:hypothetical protein
VQLLPLQAPLVLKDLLDPLVLKVKLALKVLQVLRDRKVFKETLVLQVPKVLQEPQVLQALLLLLQVPQEPLVLKVFKE